VCQLPHTSKGLGLVLCTNIDVVAILATETLGGIGAVARFVAEILCPGAYGSTSSVLCQIKSET
jgi:hypothetical protein